MCRSPVEIVAPGSNAHGAPKSPLRGAVIGCGMVSEFHLRAWQRIPQVEIAALCDLQIERANLRAKQFAPATRTYSSVESLLESEPLDFVDILSPPSLHRDHCLLAKKHGAHVICQKPLCPELSDAVQLVEAFRDYPKAFVVHDNHRYRPWFSRIRALYESGFFGDIKYLRLFQEGQLVLDETRSPLEDYAASYYRLQRIFVNHLRSNSPPPPAAEDNLRSLQATFAAYDSARLARYVNIALREQT
jgi:predicted dehydrogenase